MTLSHGFELEREVRIDEISALARLYRHKKTNAELLSILGEDENKVFGVSFRTPPSSSDGIAHIMEHSVLCGSRKYPVKAPFLEMLKGSLNTFLNAMTYPDMTVYPVASTNLQDFYNLVCVYLDAVFHPRITTEILEQEGWHYELDSPDAPLIYKGVVFNEMKGVYSSPDIRVSRLSTQSLYPDTIYGVDSGGDPSEIPNLTYAKFKAFHDTFYHPSNARIFFYGDDDPEKRLEILDGVLSEFSPVRIDSQVPLQRRFSAPRKLEEHIPAAEQEGGKQAQITVNWMLDEIGNVETGLALAILSRILVGTPAAPLRKALIDSRLGDDIAATGLDSELRQMRFGAGLKGIAPEDAGKVEALILDTLGKLASDGIDPMTVEATVNTIEFRLRENNTGSYPRGLSVMFRALQYWKYDRDPLAPLAWETPMQAIKARLAKGERVFEELIRSQLLDNPHRTTVLFKPDLELAAKEAAEERARLDAARAAMSEADIAKVIEETRKLKRMQETPDSPEALATIPMLTLKDLPTRETPIPIETRKEQGALIATHDLPTNGILYIDIGLDLRRVPAELLPYVGIFRRALLETGAGKDDFVQLSQRIGRLTGGVSSQVWTSAKVGSGEAVARQFLYGKALASKAGELFAILTDVLLNARLDNAERIEQLVNEERASEEGHLAMAGSWVADMRLRSNLCEADWASEQIQGISYLHFLRKVCSEGRAGIDAAVAALHRLRDLMVRRDAMVFNLTAAAGDLERVQPDVERLIAALPSGAPDRPQWRVGDLPRFEGLTMPAKVNYVVKGESLARLGHVNAGAAQVASQLLRGSWLWEKVRVQGGAYGALVMYSRRSGILTFGSYRDPNLLQTIAAYDGSAGFLRTIADNRKELDRAIIGTIGQIDHYKLPDTKGIVSLQRYLVGDGPEELQKFRDEVLGAKAEDIRAFADALDEIAARGRVVVLGSEEAIKTADAELQGRFTLTKVI